MWKLADVKLWVAVWITFEFDDRIRSECIFVSHVIGECTDGNPPAFFSHEDIVRGRNEWIDLSSGKSESK